jgi:ATP-dependent DNA ligase
MIYIMQLSEAIVGKGEAMFREACRMGLEGMVSKRLGSAYVSTRTRKSPVDGP